MDAEIKAAWVKWLREHADQQGKGQLRKDGKFCCLGGLCELAVGAGIVGASPAKVSDLDADNTFEATVYDSEMFVLPDKVAKWASLIPFTDSDGVQQAFAVNPEVSVLITREMVDKITDKESQDIYVNSIGRKRYLQLSTLNDVFEFSFDEIADLIDAQF
jgi:hypothetical protein